MYFKTPASLLSDDEIMKFIGDYFDNIDGYKEK